MRTHRQIEADPQSEVAKYIDRLGLSTLARRCQAVGSQQLPVVRQHAADDRFIELTRFDSTGDTIIDDVCRIIRTRARLWSADPQRLYNSIFELGYNVEQHAASTGLVAVQHSQVEYRSGHQPRSFGLAYSSPGTLAVGQITTSEGPAT
jgi:hypothetical protein